MALVRDGAGEEVGSVVCYGKSVENVSCAKVVGSINNQISTNKKLIAILRSKGFDYCLCPGPGVARAEFPLEDFCFWLVEVALISA